MYTPLQPQIRCPEAGPEEVSVGVGDQAASRGTASGVVEANERGGAVGITENPTALSARQSGRNSSCSWKTLAGPQAGVGLLLPLTLTMNDSGTFTAMRFCVSGISLSSGVSMKRDKDGGLSGGYNPH